MRPHEEDDGATRDTWLDLVCRIEFAWADWFEQARTARASWPTSWYRGDQERPAADEVTVEVLAFDDAEAGSGLAVVMLARVSSPRDPSALTARGARRLALRLTPRTGDRETPSAWSGPASGRMLVDGQHLDFFARDGAHLHQHDGWIELDLVLGDAWVDRDETPQELLAGLEKILVMRDDASFPAEGEG